MSKIKIKNKTRNAITGYAFISLWLIGLVIFTIVPLGQAIFYSFNDAQFKGSGIETTWIWFDNFIYAFYEDSVFPEMLVNYLGGIIVQVPFAITAALIISMLLNQSIKMRGFWRVIFFLPVVISTGPVINELLTQGAASIAILSDGTVTNFLTEYLPKFISLPLSLLFENLIIVLWYTGIPIILFLAGLQRINRQTYEAASIDGASPWQSFWKITLPSMKSFILVGIIYEIVILSFSDIPQGNNKKNILTYMEEQMLSTSGKGYGYACTLGIIYFLIIVIQIGIYVLLLRDKYKLKKVKKHE